MSWLFVSSSDHIAKTMKVYSTFCLLFFPIFLSSSLSAQAGDWYLGGSTSVRSDIQQTNIFRRPMPAILRLNLLARYELHNPLSFTIQAGYRQERSRITEADVGPGFGLSFAQSQIHYFNPEFQVGYTLLTDAGAGVMFFTGLGRKIPVWSRTLSVDNSGEGIEQLATRPREFRATYLLIGVEVPIFTEGRSGLTLQPEISLPLSQPPTATTRFEAGISLVFRGGSF
jgi:hypothetical protein